MKWRNEESPGWASLFLFLLFPFSINLHLVFFFFYNFLFFSYIWKCYLHKGLSKFLGKIYQILPAQIRQTAVVQTDPPLGGMNIVSSLDMFHLDFLILKIVGKLVPEACRWVICLALVQESLCILVIALFSGSMFCNRLVRRTGHEYLELI